MSDVEGLKREAGITACSFVRSGMKLGLGTGSTVKYTIIEIGRMISEEGMDVVGVPTSESTRELAESLGIPLMSISEAESLDLTIDGADEFDPNFSLIKGGGGALTREKEVALISDSMIVVADDRKKVPVLGKFDLPIEVDQELWSEVSEAIRLSSGVESTLRGGGESPYVTDNGGFILDCKFGPTIVDPANLEAQILSIGGVVQVGLFVDLCDAVVMSTESGVEVIINPVGRLP
ncbi:ribose-5-phosphate isomerase RpiA [Euryarchaeota archaeon]|nr:ribose-5-phosphate isomerase RpiA [Euryarchaeota archaeon]|tara:strand:+ start:4773 stop:5477 length:705 start_codon:yes stop_codon:yes gene_type:complete